MSFREYIGGLGAYVNTKSRVIELGARIKARTLRVKEFTLLNSMVPTSLLSLLSLVEPRDLIEADLDAKH